MMICQVVRSQRVLSKTNSLVPTSIWTPSTARVVEPSRATKDLETPPTSMKAVPPRFSFLVAISNTGRITHALFRWSPLAADDPPRGKARSSAQSRRCIRRRDHRSRILPVRVNRSDDAFVHVHPRDPEPAHRPTRSTD